MGKQIGTVDFDSLPISLDSDQFIRNPVYFFFRNFFKKDLPKLH